MRILKYYVENKALFEIENKVNENKLLSYCDALKYIMTYFNWPPSAHG